MRALLIVAIAAVGLPSLEASAQERGRQRSPEREAQRQICRQEARLAYRVRDNGVTRSAAVQDSVKAARRDYVRNCMRQSKAALR